MSDAHTDPAALPALLHTLRTAWQANRPSLDQRRDDLQRLRAALKARLPQMADAISADFGHRSPHESMIADGMTVLGDIDHLLKHLRRWARPRRVGVGWRFWPARAQTRAVPLGVVGVISPWNYPVIGEVVLPLGECAAGAYVPVHTGVTGRCPQRCNYQTHLQHGQCRRDEIGRASCRERV